jgi:hypothetical protein
MINPMKTEKALPKEQNRKQTLSNMQWLRLKKTELQPPNTLNQ